ncbi:energy-coupling factor transporter transmembrane protein EcfT [Sporolactobacillus sp. THM7-7]|nr:energy-coupling factor transporter transmembrane protein EcfT [Sporolactobacillus sp. THM7-7]
MTRFEWSRKITIGHYIPIDSIIHRLDSSCKLLGFTVLIVAIAFCNSYFGNVLFFTFALFLFVLSRLPIRYGLSGIKPAIPFMVILAVLQLLFYGGGVTASGTVYIHYSFLLITSDSVRLVVVSAMRFVEIILVSSVLTLSTPETELMHGMERLLKPLKYIRFPVHQFSLIIMIAVRFVPTFAMEMEKLMKAQASRGAAFGTGRWWQIIRRTKDMFPLMIPLFRSAMARADDLVLAMECRCFVPGQSRTTYRRGKARSRDFSFLLIIIGFSLFALFYPFPG